MPQSIFQLAHQLSEQQFYRYKQASASHLIAGADRLELGITPPNPSVERLAAVDQADAALEITRRELDVARADYLHQPDAAFVVE
jgi:hypothetical protein